MRGRQRQAPFILREERLFGVLPQVFRDGRRTLPPNVPFPEMTARAKSKPNGGGGAGRGGDDPLRRLPAGGRERPPAFDRAQGLTVHAVLPIGRAAAETAIANRTRADDVAFTLFCSWWFGGAPPVAGANRARRPASYHAPALRRKTQTSIFNKQIHVNFAQRREIARATVRDSGVHAALCMGVAQCEIRPRGRGARLFRRTAPVSPLGRRQGVADRARHVTRRRQRSGVVPKATWTS